MDFLLPWFRERSPVTHGVHLGKVKELRPPQAPGDGLCVAHTQPFCSFAFIAWNDWSCLKERPLLLARGRDHVFTGSPPRKQGSPALCGVVWECDYLDSHKGNTPMELCTCPISCCILGLIWVHSSQSDCMLGSRGKFGAKGTDSWALPTAASQRLGLGICNCNKALRCTVSWKPLMSCSVKKIIHAADICRVFCLFWQWKEQILKEQSSFKV